MEELIRELRDIQDKWGKDTVTAIIKKLDFYSIKWQGVLKKSIKYRFDKRTDDVTFTMADYGKFIDEGVDGTQRKNAIGENREKDVSFKGNIPGTAYHIKKWADSKGLNNWAVATNLQKYGIKPRRFFNDVIDKRSKILGELIIAAEEEYLDNTINNMNAE